MGSSAGFRSIWIIFLSLSLTAVLPTIAHAVIPTAEREALIALYNATGGDSWTFNTNWKTDGAFSPAGTECSWFGVKCDVDSLAVFELEINGNNLTGAIPPEIGNLSSLSFVTLRSNRINAIPLEIAKLTNLQWLYLDGNLLSTIPPELANLGKLQILDLNSNQLVSIPPGLANSSSLQRLDLSSNQISSIPPELGKLSSLILLYLGNNQLSAVPVELGDLNNLQLLDLSTNQISSIPPELSKLGNLVALLLHENLLSSVPPELGKLSNLAQLNLYSNQLTAIPPELGNLSNLGALYLWSNQLTTVPAELGKLTNLVNLRIMYNQLSTIPPELGKLSKLSDLNLSDNLLSTIPPELGDLSSLRELNLSGNKLVGAIPGGFINLTALDVTYLSLDYNGLYTFDTALLSFLNSKTASGDLMATQTLDADGVVSMGVTDTTVGLAWNAVGYTQAGGYRIYISTQADTGYILNSEISDKSTTSGTATGLSNCLSYYAKIQSYTLPHAGNINEVESDGQTGNIVDFTTSCTPVITGGTGGFTVAEDLSIGSIITTITAMDSDSASWSYSITAGNDEGKFVIDSTSGELSTVVALDFETTTHYTLTVAVDDGISQASGVVTVNVTDVDDTAAPGSGGCNLHPGSEFDPLLPLMLLMAFYYLGYQKRGQPESSSA